MGSVRMVITVTTVMVMNLSRNSTQAVLVMIGGGIMMMVMMSQWRPCLLQCLMGSCVGALTT